MRSNLVFSRSQWISRQRTVGFLINAASLYSYRSNLTALLMIQKDLFRESPAKRRNYIDRAVSLAAFVVILLIRELDPIPALHGPMFDPIAFAIDIAGDRDEPLEEAAGRSLCNASTTPFRSPSSDTLSGRHAALVAGALAYRAGSSHFGAASYLLGYLLATLITVAWLRSHMRRSAKTGPSNAVADGDGPKSANHI